jgi:hypothetical protein
VPYCLPTYVRQTDVFKLDKNIVNYSLGDAEG